MITPNEAAALLRDATEYVADSCGVSLDQVWIGYVATNMPVAEWLWHVQVRNDRVTACAKRASLDVACDEVINRVGRRV